MTYRLEDSLEREAEHPQLIGTKENFSFALLLALSLKQLCVLTGHWWYEEVSLRYYGANATRYGSIRDMAGFAGK